jgi:hypothetical protein
MVSTALAGKYVGLEEPGNGIWIIHFRRKLLGRLDEKTLRIEDEKGRAKRGSSGSVSGVQPGVKHFLNQVSNNG